MAEHTTPPLTTGVSTPLTNPAFKPTSNHARAARVIALVDQRARQATTTVAPISSVAPSGLLADTRGRPLHDLRISVTDRCNFRCSYCMPKEVFDKDYPYLPHAALLSFEEITRLARLFLAHGVRKIRLTGGEPLLRRNIEALVAQLAGLRTADGQQPELTLTTNGSLLARKAMALKDAGLQRVTISLDALDDTVFKQMNDVDFPVAEVLRGIEAAQRAGFGQTGSGSGSARALKVNMVVKHGTNHQQIVPMARHFRGSGVTLRLIEYMDVGATNGWQMHEVMPSADVVRLLQQEFALIPLHAAVPGETAQRWGYANAQGQHDPALGEIGVISSVTQAFCGDCNRARLSTQGHLYLCLFASQGHDLRSLLRGGATDADIASAIGNIWHGRSDRYSELRSAATQPVPRSRVEMSYIGG